MTECILLTIGKELLIGQVIDTNSGWLGKELNDLGINVRRVLSVADDEKEIKEAIGYGLKNATIVIATGGLGPTRDDITKKCIADYFEDTLEFHQETYDGIVSIFKKFGREPQEAHRIQAFMPTKAIILKNNLGTAPGMLFKQENKLLLSLPGVPYEMKTIFSQHFAPILKRDYVKDIILHRTIRTVGIGESVLATEIDDIVNDFPEELNIAYLPSLGTVRLRLSANGKDEEELRKLIQAYETRILERIGEYVFGFDLNTLEESVQTLAVRQNKKIATAESCTGGAIAKRITSVPGASAYYEGSLICYSNELKTSMLNVNPKTLEKHGAVSEDTVIEMCHSCVDKLKVDLAVAVSGIAGPGGGSIEKPVGTVWLACGNKSHMVTKKLSLAKDRKLNIEYTTTYALNMLRKFLMTQ